MLPFRFVAVPVCGRSGLWQFRSVAVPVYGRFGCGRFGLWPFRMWPFRFVAVMTCYLQVHSIIQTLINHFSTIGVVGLHSDQWHSLLMRLITRDKPNTCNMYLCGPRAWRTKHRYIQCSFGCSLFVGSSSSLCGQWSNTGQVTFNLISGRFLRLTSNL